MAWRFCANCTIFLPVRFEFFFLPARLCLCVVAYNHKPFINSISKVKKKVAFLYCARCSNVSKSLKRSFFFLSAFDFAKIENWRTQTHHTAYICRRTHIWVLEFRLKRSLLLCLRLWQLAIENVDDDDEFVQLLFTTVFLYLFNTFLYICLFFAFFFCSSSVWIRWNRLCQM